MRDAGLPVTLIVVGLAWLAWHFGWSVLIPALLVWLGALMLVARHPRFPDKRIRAPAPPREP